MIDANIASLVADIGLGAITSIAALWSHQSRDAVKSLDHRIGAVEQILMGGRK